MSDNAIITQHNLDFYSAIWDNPMNDQGWMLYRIGTVHGQWRMGENGFEILSFQNELPGNGHLNDVFEWFEYACKRDKVDLLIREIMNQRFKKHLIEKRGFAEVGSVDVIKKFKA